MGSHGLLLRRCEVQANSFGRGLRGFFGDYWSAVRGNGRHTVLSYRGGSKLLLRFLEQRLGPPAFMPPPQAVLPFPAFRLSFRKLATASLADLPIRPNWSGYGIVDG